jgi:hypothetical protein
LIEKHVRRISDDLFTLFQDRILIKQKFRLKRRDCFFKSFKEIQIEGEKIVQGYSYVKIPERIFKYFLDGMSNELINCQWYSNSPDDSDKYG